MHNYNNLIYRSINHVQNACILMMLLNIDIDIKYFLYMLISVKNTDKNIRCIFLINIIQHN